ncbi:hypothetical protein JYU34_009397 [Plutella xylostella]|uniref:WDR19 WD40 repeat domain-containing protein n=1 Tax=Plutella xylostella TaxID=51655 RepID=A0ABQ7QJC5_PLUXY|nr:hypothetical protein JYU34_009397 [Plutella xylostella]
MQGANIVAAHLTADFFIFATDHGHIEYFSLDEWRSATRYKHSSNITSLHCDIGGTRAFFTDDKHRAYIYSPAYDEICPVENMPAHFKGVIWDICLSERNVLAIYTDSSIHTYHYSPHGVSGPRVAAVAATPLPAAHAPLILSAGTVYCGSNAGITKIALESHNTAGLADADPDKRTANQKKHIEKLLLLCRFHEARLFCDALEDEEMWRKLGEAAILQLQHEFAVSVYTKLNDVAMVWALEDAADIEDMPTLWLVAVFFRVP